MTLRSTGMWAGFILATGSLTGCAGSGANSNFQRTNPSTFKNITPPTPMAATPTANTGSGQATQPAAATGNPSALAAPMGNTPQFSNQPIGGITPAGGIAPPMPLPSVSSPVPAAPAPVPSTSNMLPTINGVSSGAPVMAAPAPSRQVAVNAVRTVNPSAPNTPTPVAPAPMPIDSSSGPTMPPAQSGSELPPESQQPITHLSPVTLPPTTVRQ